MMRQPFALAADRSGVTAVEFALVAPIFFLLAVGTAKFGITLNNYIMLTEAVSTGARQFALSRGAPAPRTNTVNLINNAATGLATANLAITTMINGTACLTDSACSSELSSAAGQPASITATYPCDLVVLGYNFAPGCTLSSTMAERIE